MLLVPLVTGLVGVEANAAPANKADLRAVDALTPTSRVQGNKAPTSRLAKTDPSLLGKTDSAPVQVLIKLDYDSTATYTGGVRGLQATSPSATGQELSANSDSVKRYDGYITGREKTFAAELSKRVPQARLGQSLRTVYGGMAATVPANKIADVLAIPGVVAVQGDKLNKLTTDSSPRFIGANAVYNELRTTRNAGQGVIFGDLDTGVWPEHPSFADQGNLPAPPATADGHARACNFGDNPLTPAPDVFRCNNKLIGGQPFLTTYLSDPTRAANEPFHTARDSNGHGTHTTSTAAGNIVTGVSVLGGPLPDIHGIAPGAYVIEYKVCGIEGCFSSDSARAVAQAILDGVKVINFSISGGTDPFTDPVELAFLDAYAAGVFVSASAGNEGPGAGTANHLSPWVMSVAASTQRREFASTLTVTAPGGATFTADGASITPGAGPLPIVLSSAPPYNDNLCVNPAPAGTFTGKIVACQRGGNARVQKGFNVFQGGAAGMVLYNPTLADTETDTHWLPTVHLADGTAFRAFLTANPGSTAQFTAGQARDGQGDVMAAFSSRGPAGNFIKPDVTAPGVQILAGDTPVIEDPGLSGPGNEFFQAIAGTSMSSPHDAGAAILMKAMNNTWTPGQVKSALMTTATTNVVKENLTTPADPFDIGAGRINLRQSWVPGLTFDESAARMAALGNDPVNAIHLNIPSVNAPLMPGRVSTIRTAKNVSGLRMRYTTEATAPAGTSITVQPRNFTLDPGQSAQITITIQSTAAPGTQFFGQVRLVPSRNSFPTLHLPVAFRTGQTAVSLTSSCDLSRIPVQGVTTCSIDATNNSSNDANVDFTTTVNDNLRVVGATDAFIVNNRTVQKPNVALAGAQAGLPTVDTVPEGSPAGGYLPLASLGIAPIDIGDEDVLNFGTPAFRFNGVTYTSVGVDSNGYLIAGGGSSQDNKCCDLPAGPDPSAPNNIMAPLWTDLDGSEADGIFAGIVTDGVNDWIVIEHNVKVFDTDDLRKFQVWIGINGVQDISYTYSAPQGPFPPDQTGFLVGAENTQGQGDMEAVLPNGDDKVVTSTEPTPGASTHYTVTVRGVRSGTGKVTTEMEGPGLPGVTIVTSNVVVSNRRVAAGPV